nr:(2Fe-2S)-binding protein [uncultured Blautia sp.]
MVLNFKVNGEERVMEASGSMRLLDFIREELQLTGTKEGCGEGECGACTVILDGEAVHACLTLTGQLQGKELLTIEGLEKNGELDALQKAFIRKSAIQCGFCTSGMIMSAKALLMKVPNPTDEQIKRALAGNICRCSGYREIREAVREAADAGKGEEQDV